jgi:hypothetical protein
VLSKKTAAQTMTPAVTAIVSRCQFDRRNTLRAIPMDASGTSLPLRQAYVMCSSLGSPDGTHRRDVGQGPRRHSEVIPASRFLLVGRSARSTEMGQRQTNIWRGLTSPARFTSVYVTDQASVTKPTGVDLNRSEPAFTG